MGGSRRPFSNIEEDVDDIECDNPECPEEVQELKQEILSAYQQLKNMCSLLRQRGSGKQRRNSTDSLETTSSSEEPRASQVRVGLLHEVMQELKGLLHDILRKEAKGSCPACGADVNDRLKLEVQLHKTTENFEKLERNLKKKEDESRAREDEMRELMSKLSVTEIQLKVELSQQLDQWQQDMQELLEEQMNRKMKQQQKGKSQGGGADSDSSQSQGERKRSKLFSFLK